jgi:hypothetical protein
MNLFYCNNYVDPTKTAPGMTIFGFENNLSLANLVGETVPVTLNYWFRLSAR